MNAVFRAPGGSKYTVWFTSHREKHERRLSAMGLTGVMANAFSVNTELSVLTMAGSALSQARASKSATTARVATPAWR